MKGDNASENRGRTRMETEALKMRPAYMRYFGTKSVSTRKPKITRPKRSKMEITANKVAGSMPTCNEFV